MNYLKAAFWDYPEFADPEAIRAHLGEEDEGGICSWLLARLLEHGRAVDTLEFFSPDTISRELPQLRLKPYTLRKWRRIVEVYGQSQGE